MDIDRKNHKIRKTSSEDVSESKESCEETTHEFKRILLLQVVSEDGHIRLMYFEESKARSTSFLIRGEEMTIEQILKRWAAEGPSSVFPVEFFFFYKNTFKYPKYTPENDKLVAAACPIDSDIFAESSCGYIINIDTDKATIVSIYTCCDFE